MLLTRFLIVCGRYFGNRYDLSVSCCLLESRKKLFLLLTRHVLVVSAIFLSGIFLKPDQLKLSA
jgi:hypothetical protein